MSRATVKVKGKGEAQLWSFATMGEMADYLHVRRGDYYMKTETEEAWRGGSGAETVSRCRSGDLPRVKDSDRLLGKIEADIDLPTGRFQNIRTVAGGAPIVPAMLASHPKAMRARRRVASNLGPVAILVDVTVSAGVDTATIARRGAATLALARALSAVRPVEVWGLGGLRVSTTTSLMAFKVESNPLDLARAAWALGANEVLRRAMFTMASDAADLRETNNHIPWAFSDHGWQQKNLPAWFADHLGIDDFVAVGLLLLGTSFNSDDMAAAWVRDQIAALRGSSVAA